MAGPFSNLHKYSSERTRGYVTTLNQDHISKVKGKLNVNSIFVVVLTVYPASIEKSSLNCSQLFLVYSLLKITI